MLYKNDTQTDLTLQSNNVISKNVRITEIYVTVYACCVTLFKVVLPFKVYIRTEQ